MKGQTVSQPNSLEKFQISALNGSVKDIISELDIISDSTLNQTELKLKHDYINRFKYKNDQIELKTENILVNDIYKIYRKYWHNILMEIQLVDVSENELKNELNEYFRKHYDKSIPKDIFEFERELLKKENLNTANGKTAGIYDLLVWAKEDSIVYNVELPECKINVSVVFMDIMISMGWEEYATLGKYYPGGWATENSLYCVKTAYDTSGENFKISYLKHEAQHYADYKLYPKLSGTDLEYRAKLTELSYAKETLFKLISFFVKNSGEDRDNPHSFANYHVIKYLSVELFNSHIPFNNIDEWKMLDVAVINKAAMKLLKQNSIELNKIGSGVVNYIE